MIYYNKSIRYIFIILGLNFACAIGYIGNILVEGNYSFVADLSILISLIYILFLPFIGYVLHAFLRKRVALKLNKVVLDDLAEFEVLSDKKLKNNPSLEIEDKEYRSKFIRTANSIGDYNKVFEIIKLNYFIIFAFCTIAIVSNFKQFNIETYAILETSFFILLSLILYFLSIKRENKIKNMLNKYKVSSGLL